MIMIFAFIMIDLRCGIGVITTSRKTTSLIYKQLVTTSKRRNLTHEFHCGLSFYHILYVETRVVREIGVL